MRALTGLAVVLGWGAIAVGQEKELPLREFFEAEVARIEARPLAGVGSGEEWKEKRPELQRQLREMLGMDPLPPRTDLKVVVTGTLERPGFVVEKLHFQSMPGLYVTANLYRPKEVTGKLPGILYVCGHGGEEKDGVIYGNKAHYQHHPAWYAQNGFVCLIVDTLELGEVPGVHHGTYQHGRFWWQSRGYTPAGVETWNGMRALDYLASRPEVDAERLGVTGRSGGGATSWWLGALDDRLKAVIPVAGITDLRNHLLKGGEDGTYPNGCIDGHCDCMYFVNTYRWDFDTLAALVAPKAMLVENTDLDTIFPIDGVRRVYAKLEKVYGDWYGEKEKLGLVIGKGGHADTEELRHPSFVFMKKWLRGEEVGLGEIKETGEKIPMVELKAMAVGAPLPEDQINDRVDEVFVAAAKEGPVPKSEGEWKEWRSRKLKEVGEKVFGGWPGDREEVPLDLKKVDVDSPPLLYEYKSQEGVSLRLSLSRYAEKAGVSRVGLIVVWPPVENGGAIREAAEGMGGVVALAGLRGKGFNRWPEEWDASMGRRFALLGQTLDGQRVWDVRRAIRALAEVPETKDAEVDLIAAEGAVDLAMWVAAFEPSVARVICVGPVPTKRDARPALLNVDRLLAPGEAMGLAYPCPLVLPEGTDPKEWEWAFGLGRALGKEWPVVEGGGR